MSLQASVDSAPALDCDTDLHGTASARAPESVGPRCRRRLRRRARVPWPGGGARGAGSWCPRPARPAPAAQDASARRLGWRRRALRSNSGR